ncbi:COMM domain-containing protein 4 [Ditylenchus destructor]|uniref:COMM domain-containing protein 4 n=1 Tax=Ditylenchus destructor TaxID=166010 RepID=A0AAD4RD90_9BILA|nr:COMM domain-containing protein 4 [Ditylenchus destructor]
MKFRFIGGLDCPDWILSQIAEFSSISPDDFKQWCLQIANRLKFKQSEWSSESLRALQGAHTIDLRSMKAMIAALSFIIEKSAKSNCSPIDLESEMLQLGFSTEHAKQLSSVYATESEALSKRIATKFIREPSFTLIKRTSQSVDDVTVENLNVKTSDGKHINLAMGSNKLALMTQGIKDALGAIEIMKDQ